MSGISGSGNGNERRKSMILSLPLSKRPRVSTHGRSAAGPSSQIEPETNLPLSDSPSSSEGESDTDSSQSSESGSDEQEETAPEDSDSTMNSTSSESERALHLTLTDPSILDCPICHGPLVSPVHQCRNGHIACSLCRTKMGNKCPECRLPTGIIRCRVLEKILESVAVNCRNKMYGCTQIFKRDQKQNQLDHEKICCYNLCTCPYDDCSYIGIAESLYKHFSEVHSPSTFSFDTMKSVILDVNRTQVFLQDSSRSCLFVLKRTIKYPGSFVSVTCVGPDSMGRDFSYDLTAVIDSGTCVNIKADVKCVWKWTAESVLVEKCLVLPQGMVSRSERLKVELVIRRNPTSGS